MRVKFSLMRQLLLVSVLLLASSAYGESELARYLYLVEPDNASAVVLNTHSVQRSLDDDNFELAVRQSRDLLAAVELVAALAPADMGKLLSNHGAILTASGRYAQGVEYSRNGLEMLDEVLTPYDVTLVNALTGLALGLVAQNQFDEAKDLLHRAQHIVHRVHGIHAAEQLRLLAYLAAINVRQGDMNTADQQQRFALMVTESNFSGTSPDLVPGLIVLANYFSARGSAISRYAPIDRVRLRNELFTQSTRLYERAIRIVETHYGDNDIRLAPALQGLARVVVADHKKFRKAEQYLQRRLEVIERGGTGDIADVAAAMVDLGDLQLLASDADALDTYLDAWRLLQQTPETQALARQWFEQPKLVNRSVPGIIYLGRRPDAADPGEPLFADLKFDVSERGVVRNFNWVDKNVPLAEIRSLRGSIRRARYRPAISDGEFVAARGVEWRQHYRVEKRTFSTSISSNPLSSGAPRSMSAGPQTGSTSRLAP